MLLILYFKIISNFWSIKIGFKNQQNQWGKLQKINSVLKRPMFILFKYYYCFLIDTFIPQFNAKTVFILWLRSIKIFDVGLNVLVRKAQPYPKEKIINNLKKTELKVIYYWWHYVWLIRMSSWLQWIFFFFVFYFTRFKNYFVFTNQMKSILNECEIM
jgi:hypothetical protein